MFCFIAGFERAAKIKKIAIYCSLISLPVPELIRFKEEWFQVKRLPKMSKSIKFVTLCAGQIFCTQVKFFSNSEYFSITLN